MQSAYEAVDSPRAAFRSRSRVVGAATFLFAAGALAHLGRTAQRPGAAELLPDDDDDDDAPGGGAAYRVLPGGDENQADVA